MFQVQYIYATKGIWSILFSSFTNVLKMDEKKKLYRAALLLHYRSGKSADEAHRLLLEEMKDQAPSRATCFRWYGKFDKGGKCLEDCSRSGRPLTRKKQLILAICEERPNVTVRELATSSGAPKSTVHDVLRASGKVAKLPRVLPHALSPHDKKKRVEVCTSLLSRHRTLSWIDSIVTMDEKYCVYDNTVRRKHWVDFDELPKPQPKHPDHDKKELLSFWWDIKGPVFWELVPTGSMVDSERFCTQLERVAEILRSRRRGGGKILLLMDNARPHTSKRTQSKLRELEIELVPHPPYSPDLAPSDFHIFRSLQSSFAGKKFTNREDVELAVNNFLKSKPPEFFANGIRSLPQRWQYVKEHNGEYYSE